MKRLKILILVALVSPAQAGVVMKYMQKNHEPRVEECELEVEIDVQLFRTNLQCKPKPGLTSIFDGKRQVMIYVDHSKKTYFEATEEGMKSALEQMKKSLKTIEAANKKMESQLVLMPPEKRAAMEKTLSLNAAKLRQGDVVATKDGPLKKVGNFICQPYSRTIAGTKIGEVCLAEWKEAKVNFEPYKNIAESLKVYWDKWQKPMSSGASQRGLNSARLADGFAVQEKVLVDGRVLSEKELVSVSEKALSAESLKPPASYKKQSPP